MRARQAGAGPAPASVLIVVAFPAGRVSHPARQALIRYNYNVVCNHVLPNEILIFAITASLKTTS